MSASRTKHPARRPTAAEVIHAYAVLARADVTAAELRPGDEVVFQLHSVTGAHRAGRVEASHPTDRSMGWRLAIAHADGIYDFRCAPGYRGCRLVTP